MGTINFEEVYANAYVRESVETLVATTARQYPMLANYQDDIGRNSGWRSANAFRNSVLKKVILIPFAA